MTQEEQTALVDGQHAAANAAANTGGDTAKAVEEQVKGAENEQQTTDDSNHVESRERVLAIFRRLATMQSVRRVSPAAKAAKAAKQAARAAEQAARAAQAAAQAAHAAAKAAQDAAESAMEENKKASQVEKPAAEATTGLSESDNKQPEQVAAK